MIEARRGLPACQSMAAHAVRAYLAAMLICVAAHTVARQAQVGAVQVFDLNARTRGRGNVPGLVTVRAGYSRMFSFEHKTRLTVIERFAVRIPVDESKILSVVFGMAARAVLARRILPGEGSMQSAPAGNALTDFRVAIETLELPRAAAQIVAFRAIRRPG